MAFDHPVAATADLLVPSMKCAGCMAGIERALMALPGVQTARCNLTQHRVRAVYDPALIDRDAMVRALEEAGWTARLFQAGAGPEDDRTARDLLLRIGVAGFAAMNVMLLSVSVWSGADGAIRDLLHWVSALIALPALAYAGMPFFRGAARALSARRINMDMPIAVAIVLASASSIVETVQSGEHAYFDAGVMLVFFLLIGRYLDHRTRARARTSVAELSALATRSAMRVFPDGRRESVPVEELAPGMAIEIAPGERIPADGAVRQGCSDLDRALVTGESVPEPVGPGDIVHAGMVNLTGPLTVEITATGDATLLAEIARMVDAAERGQTRYDRLADKAARIYAPGVHLAALLTFLGWIWASGDWQVSLGIATAVLIITCPCALGLAVPTVHTVASGRLFRAGAFLKDGAELERLAEIDMVVFDKTGTLTDGHPRLVEGDAPEDSLAIAAALAAASQHPYSVALAREAADREVAPAPVTDVREHPGLGVEGRFDGRIVLLGKPDWTRADPECFSVGLDLGNGESRGFVFADTLRPDAAATCRQLRAMGLELVILSGDREGSVARAAEEVGIDRWFANRMPADKHALVRDWQAEGRRILMVGDGMNDSPALAEAHASMSPSGATDIARNAAGLVFASERLGTVAEALVVARTARRRAFESFGIAAVYNLVAIPLAVAGFVTPLIAALAMSGSSVAVILNALRMRRRA